LPIIFKWGFLAYRGFSPWLRGRGGWEESFYIFPGFEKFVLNRGSKEI